MRELSDVYCFAQSVPLGGSGIATFRYAESSVDRWDNKEI